MTIAHCSGTLASRLIPGETGRVRIMNGRGINLRNNSNTNSVILLTIPAGSGFSVLIGPICPIGSEFPWYRVEYDGSEGWIAESNLNGYFVEPTGNSKAASRSLVCPGAPPSHLELDHQAQVVYDDDLAIRTRPDANSQVIQYAQPNEQFLVVGGPICAESISGDNVYWWLLRIDDNFQTGWVTEGLAGSYHLSQVN